MPQINVQPVDCMTTSAWSFRDGTPRWTSHPHGTSAVLDPFPAYPHDLDTVRLAAELVQGCWAPSWDVDLYVADREEVGRSNGFSSLLDTGHYDADHEWVRDPRRGIIFLCGKRVPPHPAVTRYLVAHEYGHNVEYMLNIARGAQSAWDEALSIEYAQVRGLPDSTLHHGDGGNWHDSIHEIIACDFRILVCETEVEFWPHAGIARPEQVPALAAWWAEARQAADKPAEPIAA